MLECELKSEQTQADGSEAPLSFRLGYFESDVQVNYEEISI